MRAQLNFARPAAGAIHLDLTVGPAGTVPYEPHEVSLRDAAPGDGDPRAALRERGFTAMPFPGGAAVASDHPGWRERFGKAVLGAVKDLTGARRIVLVAPTVVRRRGDGDGRVTPITICHADYTAASAAGRIAQLDPPHGAELLARRFAIYNVWWLESEPPQDRPLALCDPASVAAADLLAGTGAAYDTRGDKRDFGEIALFRHNPRQEWYWYPELRPDRLLVFAGYDSDPGHASLVPHTAFANPDCPPGAGTRRSLECRCFALW